MGDGGGRAPARPVVAELALALILLVGGGLLLRTFVALQRADLGFNPDKVCRFRVAAAGRTGTERSCLAIAFYDAVLARAAALPGVTHAALSSVIPLGGDGDTDFLSRDSPPPRSADALIVWYRMVSANYFAAMEIPLRRGRRFADASRHRLSSSTRRWRRTGPEEALGRRIRFQGDGPWFTIVGVAADVQVRGARGTTSSRRTCPTGSWANRA